MEMEQKNKLINQYITELGTELNSKYPGIVNSEKINEAIEIAKKTSKIIKQNLIFAISVKIIILILSTLGIAGMWQAIFADVGVTLITIVNTLRILK